ncbi:B12-binding domain-containing radical SAM protein [Bacteroidota bacterium]
MGLKHSLSNIGKVALILPPPWSPLTVPLGISTIAELFRRNGIECRIFDWNIMLLHEIKQKYGAKFNRESHIFWNSTYTSPKWNDPGFLGQPEGGEIQLWIDRHLGEIIDAGYKTIGLSAYETNINITKQLINTIRKRVPDSLILLGGPATSDLIEYRQKKSWLLDIDYIFYTEAEASVTLLIKNLISRKKRMQIPGTAYVIGKRHNTLPALFQLLKAYFRNNNNETNAMIFTPHVQATDMLLVPTINFDDLDLKSYKSDVIPIEFSRGCSHACRFCSESKRFRPYRPRPIDNLLQDIKIAVEKYKAHEAYMICSELNGNSEHLKSFCFAMIKSNIKIKWSGNIRFDENLNAELLKLMYLAGCTNLNFGLESGSDHVLELMNKQFNIHTASRIVEICADVGISVCINLIVGFPGETEDDFNQTLEFIGKYHKIVSIFSVSKCYVDRQAPLGRNPGRFGILTYNNKLVAVSPDQPAGNELPAIIPHGPHWSDWCTINGDNTPFIRNQRYQKILLYLDKLGRRGNTPQDAKKSSDLSELSLKD